MVRYQFSTDRARFVLRRPGKFRAKRTSDPKNREAAKGLTAPTQGEKTSQAEEDRSRRFGNDLHNLQAVEGGVVGGCGVVEGPGDNAPRSGGDAGEDHVISSLDEGGGGGGHVRRGQ